ncbi:Hypothetical protein SMAX5B_019838 [Scophthalmus maximus]|uniref:Uncharacterized protein n=1 Tax=Scophthalmus maximus TaxID=52904 RepID=A0A2U9B3T2_SCOMX|nr:Hypothetical protein SMAX5B_019838 [Scophthalmus maximus]
MIRHCWGKKWSIGVNGVVATLLGRLCTKSPKLTRATECGIDNPSYTSARVTSPCRCVARVAPPTGEWAASQIGSPSSCSLSAPEATAVRCDGARCLSRGAREDAQ